MNLSTVKLAQWDKPISSGTSDEESQGGNQATQVYWENGREVKVWVHAITLLVEWT